MGCVLPKLCPVSDASVADRGCIKIGNAEVHLTREANRLHLQQDVKRSIRKLPSNSHSNSRPLRYVVAGLILRGEHPQREVLICQRSADKPMGLKWEFPGGKVEPGESSEQALARELDEELGIQARIGQEITAVRHNYRNGGSIHIQFFTIESFTGELRNVVFQDMQWSALERLPEYDFLAADQTLIRELAAGKLL
jgi:8-oxo-dGTP diphosphatase